MYLTYHIKHEVSHITHTILQLTYCPHHIETYSGCDKYHRGHTVSHITYHAYPTLHIIYMILHIPYDTYCISGTT